MQNIQNHQIEADRALIAALGGPAKVAERLNYQKLGGVQRVQNWTVRGIPSAVKVQRPDLFMPEFTTEQSTA
jgi:hypothetical protein